MQVLEKNKGEIEIKASKMSDFLRMEYLESCLKQFRDFEIQKFCAWELAKLYENRFMYPEAVKYIFKFQEITGNPLDKKKAAQKEVELLIKGGFYDKAESAIKKAAGMMNDAERFELKRNLINWYKDMANKAEKSGKNSELAKVYEKLVNYVVDNEKIEMKRKIAFAYKKLGRIKESMEIEKDIERYSPPDRRTPGFVY